MQDGLAWTPQQEHWSLDVQWSCTSTHQKGILRSIQLGMRAVQRDWTLHQPVQEGGEEDMSDAYNYGGATQRSVRPPCKTDQGIVTLQLLFMCDRLPAKEDDEKEFEQ